jgi:hypothetical protein
MRCKENVWPFVRAGRDRYFASLCTGLAALAAPENPAGAIIRPMAMARTSILAVFMVFFPGSRLSSTRYVMP